jgi:hypothetical protein
MIMKPCRLLAVAVVKAEVLRPKTRTIFPTRPPGIGRIEAMLPAVASNHRHTPPQKSWSMLCRSHRCLPSHSRLKTLLLTMLVLIHFNSGLAAKITSEQHQFDIKTEVTAEVMQATQPQTPCHALKPTNMNTNDKLVLSPIIFQGRLISRSNVYNNLYFVSLRVQKVLKGSVPKRLHRHMRLLFHTSSTKMSDHQRASQSQSNRHCLPVNFDVRTGRKYVIYVKKVSSGRYVAIAQPDQYTRKVRKAARKLLCQNCVSSPKVSDMKGYLSVSQGGKFKLKCKVAGSPRPKVSWLLNGRPIRPDFRISIKTKRRRSILRLNDAQGRDAGKYTCRAKNVLGEHSQTTSISIRVSAPDPPASMCPIQSFCLNGGKCLYYEMIGELVCRCPEGFAGQRCQFKKARINLPYVENEACGPYGHDIHLREICAAWKRPPVTEMTREEYESWLRVEKQVAELKRQKELEEMRKFRQMARQPAAHNATNIATADDDFEYDDEETFLDDEYNYSNEEE